MTEEEFKENKKLINYLLLKKFSKYYKILFPYKEDLIQETLLLINRQRQKFDSTKCSYSTFVFYCIRSVIFNFFKKLSAKKRIKTTLSLDETILENDDIFYIDCVHYDDDLDRNLNLNYVFNIYKKAISKESVKNKKIMDLILTGESDTNISKKFNMSKQAVNSIHQKLKLLMYIELKKNDFDSRYLDNYKINFNKIGQKYKKQIINYKEH